MRGGTIVDATIIHSTLSTKHKEGKRDPGMYQTKKGNQWYHGMKVHTGVDCGSGYVHTITGTAANVHDVAEAPKLRRPDDEVAYGDSGFLGLPERPEVLADKNFSKIKFRINRRPSSLNVKSEYDGINWEKVIEHQKSAVRCKVEHLAPIHS